MIRFLHGPFLNLEKGDFGEHNICIFTYQDLSRSRPLVCSAANKPRGRYRADNPIPPPHTSKALSDELGEDTNQALGHRLSLLTGC